MDVSPYNLKDMDLCHDKGMGKLSNRDVQRFWSVIRSVDLSVTCDACFFLLFPSFPLPLFSIP